MTILKSRLKEKNGAIFIIFLLLCILVNSSHAANSSGGSERSSVDFFTYQLKVKGIATSLHRRTSEPKEKEILQARSILADAYKKAFLMIPEIQVTTELTLRDILADDKSLEAELVTVIKKMTGESAEKTLQNGTVEKWFSVPLLGHFAFTLFNEVRPALSQPPLPLSDTENAIDGLIIDTRGVGANPVLLPAILDEENREISGPGTVDTNCLPKKGIATYVHSMEEAEKLFNIPFITKAIKASGTHKGNIVISTSEAAQIRNKTALPLIQQCRVAIVL